MPIPAFKYVETGKEALIREPEEGEARLLLHIFRRGPAISSVRHRIKGEKMKGLLIIVAIVAAWYILNRYLLPRLGVKT
jgi:hypothetical protein